MITTILKADDFITINDPVATSYSTVSGSPLAIDGISSQPNSTVRLIINTTDIGYVTTDIYGNWSFNVPNLADGTYTLIAYLITSAGYVATNTVSFAVENPDFITIDTPTEGTVIFLSPITISGTSSLPSSTINISLDGTLVTSTTTGSNGNWQVLYGFNAVKGIHTLLAQLLVGGYVVSNATADVFSAIPLVFPSGVSQARIIEGDVPTSGSGSGAGYTYSVSGSIMTINFVPAFSSTPSVQATGQRTSGSSTVTISSLSATAISIAFSSGTQTVHFAASLLQ